MGKEADAATLALVLNANKIMAFKLLSRSNLDSELQEHVTLFHRDLQKQKLVS